MKKTLTLFFGATLSLIAASCLSPDDQYQKGKDAQSYEESAKWYKKAAESGHVDAQYELAECY
ncbi:MAG: hypothetical protein KBT04_06810 [Bacteroidales bacterium]|nr:hypothetical protein [Candidatus Colimorpha onthohippi]